MNVLEVMDRLLEFAGRGVDGDDPVRPMIEAAHEARADVAELIEVVELMVRGIESGNIKSPLVMRKVNGDYVTESLHSVMTAALARVTGGAS